MTGKVKHINAGDGVVIDRKEQSLVFRRGRRKRTPQEKMEYIGIFRMPSNEIRKSDKPVRGVLVTGENPEETYFILGGFEFSNQNIPPGTHFQVLTLSPLKRAVHCPS